MLKIIVNDDKEVVDMVRKGLKENDGYCPCSFTREDSDKCLCESFRNQKTEGFCHCKLYKKVKVND